MQVRVKLNLPCPRMQHCRKTSMPTKVLRIRKQIFDRSGHGREEQRIRDLIVSAKQPVQLLRDGEGQHEVRHGQTAGLLPRRPELLVALPATGTGTMIAAVISVVLMPAIGTSVHVPAQSGRATTQHRLHRTPMRGWYFTRSADACDILRPVLPK